MAKTTVPLKDAGFGLTYTSDDISTAVTLQEAPDSTKSLVIENMSVSSSVAESAIKLFILGSRSSASATISRRYQSYVCRNAPCIPVLIKSIKIPVGHMITAQTSGAAKVAINMGGNVE